MLRSIPAPRSIAWAAVAFLCSILPLRAADDWQVPEAAIRYRLSLGQKPTHPSAGYYVHLPDGGILHGTTPATVVMGDDGKVLPSYLLWNNPESGFSIVFADPGAKASSVNVYIQPGAVARLWKPETGLTPSALLCTFPGRDNIGAAQQLGKLGRVESVVHEADHRGIPKAPFSIGGDVTGRPRPGAFYFLSYVAAPVAGTYWLAPFIHNNPCEILVDGNRLYPKEHSKLWGGSGANFDFTAGLHRIEVFQVAPGSGPYPTDMKDGWLMYLAWRQPKEKEQKGVEARIVNGTEIVHSGSCRLAAVESHDGSPVAAAIASPSLCYWFENEEPLLLYNLSALNGQATGVTCTWTFPDGSTVEGEKARWLFPGFHDEKVKLTVKSAQGASACIVPFYTFSTETTSLDNAGQRKAFRDALTGMLEAYPHNIDPVASWSEAWWNNLLRTIEGGEGHPMLLRLFTDHFDVARRKLAPAQLNPLEDLFLDLTLKQNPAEALAWLQKFYGNASDPNRQGELRLREGELQMYYLGDRKQAESIFTVLASLAGEIGARAKIRLGDLALIGGDLNKATSYYADVQNRARFQRNAAPAHTGELVGNQLVQSGAARPAAPALPGAAADLKGGALQEVSLSENVRSLTEDGFYLEARQALRTWETEFPLSKISGDYILRESGLYLKLEDWKRAQPMLEAYCREIDASSYLPDAASMLIACVRGTKAPPESIRDIIEKVKGRLKYHPVAAQLDAFLATAGKPVK